MLNLCEKPECFAELSDDHVFYALDDGRGIYGYLAVHYGTDAVIHLEVFRFSVGVMRHMLKAWEWLKGIIAKNNCKHIVASGKASNDKFDKLIMAFGFPSPTLIKVSAMEV